VAVVVVLVVSKWLVDYYLQELCYSYSKGQEAEPEQEQQVVGVVVLDFNLQVVVVDWYQIY